MKTKTLTEWLQEEEQLCAGEKPITDFNEHWKKVWDSRETALKIIRCLEAGVRNHGDVRVVMEGVEKIINEEP